MALVVVIVVMLHFATASLQAAVAVPLPLPADPSVACGKAVFLEFTELYSFCPLGGGAPEGNPDALCCKGLAEYFGMNSTKPSRNCFCVPAVWSRLTAQLQYHKVPLQKVLKYCNHAGTYITPFYQKGMGYCNGTKDGHYKPADYDVEYIKREDMRSFSEWASRLPKNWLLLTSFITAIVSVPGFLLFLWPFAFDFALTLKQLRGDGLPLW